MRLQFVASTAILGCALFAAAPGWLSAAPNTVYLTIKARIAGPAGAPPPNHEYRLENFSQSGNNFTATTPLDGSSSYIPGLAGQDLIQVLVRLEGHTLNDAFDYRNCRLTSNSVSANAASAALTVSFSCQSMHMSTATPAPVPRIVPIIRTIPMIERSPSPHP
jgi:hypothetical protein